MKKVIISIFLILFLFLGISYFYYVHNSNARKYINNWNIELSSNLKSLYEKKTEIGFQGDGTIYEIFELEKTSKLPNNLFSNKNTDFEALFKEYLVNLKINTNQYPDFKNDYYWKYIEKNNSDKLLVIINKNKTRLYIIQSLS